MKEETMDKRSQEGEGGEAMTDMTETMLDSKVREIFKLLDSVMSRTLEKNEVKIQILDLCNMALGIAYGQKYYVGKAKEK